MWLYAFTAVFSALIILIIFFIRSTIKNKNSEKKLNKSLEDALVSSEYKSVFLTSMSQEIRTPLNLIMGYTNLLMEDSSISTKGHGYIKNIGNAGNMVMGIVNDILDFMKIESGKLNLIPAEYQTAGLLNEIVSLINDKLNDKPVKFVLDINENLPGDLYGDDLRVKQIISILLINAFKYTTFGEITLIIDCMKDTVNENNIWMDITVRDTGIGIGLEDRVKIFNDFRQCEHTGTESLNMGLPIIRNLAEMMNGSISLESNLGQGSVFKVRIMQNKVNDLTIGADAAEKIRSLKYTENKRELKANLNRPDLSFARVLVVDDMQTNLDLAAGLLSKYKMQVDCVLGGMEAVEKIRMGVNNEGPLYHAIFMDHMMPGIDGIETARLIRSLGTDYAKNVPIIALTAYTAEGSDMLFFANDFQAYLSKPVDVFKLDSAVRKWVRNKIQ